MAILQTSGATRAGAHHVQLVLLFLTTENTAAFGQREWKRSVSPNQLILDEKKKTQIPHIAQLSSILLQGIIFQKPNKHAKTPFLFADSLQEIIYLGFNGHPDKKLREISEKAAEKVKCLAVTVQSCKMPTCKMKCALQRWRWTEWAPCEPSKR